MVNFIMIGVCMIAGMIFKAVKGIHPDAHKGINTWILYIALPAVSFKYLPKVNWSYEILFPAFSSVIVALGSLLFMRYYCKYKGYSQRSLSTLQLASGYSNTSFIGFPLITAFFGESNLSIAIICDQIMFLMLSTLGIITAIKGSGNKQKQVSVNFILKRLFTFPPLLACISALILSSLMDLNMAEPFFDKLAATVGPLALFSVGLQLNFSGWRKKISQISMVMLYKLIIAPVIVLLFAVLFHAKGNTAKIGIFEAAMPTLVTSSIIAEQFHLNTRITNLIIGISILAGFFTTAVWYQVIQLFLS